MSDAANPHQDATERHATWPELFFDLVAVAGVSVVAHQLEAEQPWQHAAVLAIAFAAFWILWASVTTYGNLLADSASIAVLFASMGVLGVMVASVPQLYGEHALAFAVAYVIGRLIIARPWARGSVVVDLPIVQASVGVLPWIVSIWIDGDARYVWWAVGIGLDLWVLLTQSGQRRLEQAQERVNRAFAARNRALARAPQQRHRRDHPGAARHEGRSQPTAVTALTGDVAHRTERMSLFILIVLGEGIVQLLAAAEASEQWNAALLGAALGAFVLMCSLFYFAVVRGTAGIGLLPAGALPARAMWLTHLIAAMSLVTLVAALGRLLDSPGRAIDVHTAWMLALGIGGYGAISGLAHAVARRWGRAGTIATPLVVAGVVVVAARSALAAGALGWVLAAAVAAAAFAASDRPE